MAEARGVDVLGPRNSRAATGGFRSPATGQRRMARGCAKSYNHRMAHILEPSLPRVLRQSRATPTAEVAARARQLWECYGCPAGRDEWIWLEAERQLNGLDVRRVALHQSTDTSAPGRSASSRAKAPGSATVREL
jgi:hypothetical protein